MDSDPGCSTDNRRCSSCCRCSARPGRLPPCTGCRRSAPPGVVAVPRSKTLESSRTLPAPTHGTCWSACSEGVHGAEWVARRRIGWRSTKESKPLCLDPCTRANPVSTRNGIFFHNPAIVFWWSPRTHCPTMATINSSKVQVRSTTVLVFVSYYKLLPGEEDHGVG